MMVLERREAGKSDESKVVLTPRDLIPVTLKPQRNNDITPSFQQRESKNCGARPSLCSHTHTCSHTDAHTKLLDPISNVCMWPFTTMETREEVGGSFS